RPSSARRAARPSRPRPVPLRASSSRRERGRGMAGGFLLPGQRGTTGNRRGGPGRRGGLVGSARQPGQQFRPVAIQNGEEFVVLDVPESPPDVGFAQEPEVGAQLAEADVRRQRPYLG